jgi:hypothetical protein
LKTPEALKIRTNPRATSEYITPASSPPIRTSRKKDQSMVRRESTVDSRQSTEADGSFPTVDC